LYAIILYKYLLWNTLTPALSLREREKGGSVHNMCPLPEGEGEGRVSAQCSLREREKGE